VSVEVKEGPDKGAVWHYGDPMREQRHLEQATALVDLSHRDIITITGPDRLTWLHSLTTQHLEHLEPGQGTTTLVLDPQGHLEHVLYGVDDGTTFWAHTEPGAGAAAAEWLDRMRFMMRVEVADRSAEFGLVWAPAALELPDAPVVATRAGEDSLGGRELFLAKEAVPALLADRELAGIWAYEARRIAAGVVRFGVDTDQRAIPNELGLLGVAVHLDKGCYRGQETVARIHTLGRPPRRLVLLHLDGSVNELPAVGDPVLLDGRQIGFAGGSARHYELGPIALGLVKRNVATDAELIVGGEVEIAATQEALVDPEVGLHVRARL